MRPLKVKARNLNENGQVAIEYVLLLTVFVIVIIGAINQFSGAFQAYSEALFGTGDNGYLGCLLRTGDLPGVADCPLPKFDIQNGNRIASQNAGGSGSSSTRSGSTGSSGSSSGSSGSGASGKSSSNANKSSDSAPSGARTNAERGGSSGGGADAGSGGGGNAGKKIRIGTMRPGNSKFALGESAKESDEGTSAPTEIGSFDPRRGGFQTGRTKLDRRFSSISEEEAARKAQTTSVIGKTTASDGSGIRKPMPLASQDNKKKAKSAADDEGGINFGWLLRIMIIIAIVIFVVFVVGGQVMQVSKSMD